MKDTNLTSIQLTKGTRKKLKVACASENKTYDEWINAKLEQEKKK